MTSAASFLIGRPQTTAIINPAWRANLFVGEVLCLGLAGQDCSTFRWCEAARGATVIPLRRLLVLASRRWLPMIRTSMRIVRYASRVVSVFLFLLGLSGKKRKKEGKAGWRRWRQRCRLRKSIKAKGRRPSTRGRRRRS
ncbi:hypothetical protein B0H34DRAFT_200205 [Crassisporium funariophilum]|nr:hypothetical protein B0H34DRAFT_200205 [Crassisporium funariophilum]